MRKNLVRIGYIAFIYNFTFSQGFWGNEFPEPKIKYKPETYVCYKATKPILVDGKLDDPVWAEIDFTNSFVDIEGSLKDRTRSYTNFAPAFTIHAKLLSKFTHDSFSMIVSKLSMN